MSDREPQRVGRWVAGLVLLLVVACAPTARTAGPYEAHAVKAAEAVHSALASDLLVLQAVDRGHTLAPYVSVATSDAEDDASSASSSFLSIQPPDSRSEALRRTLGDAFDQAQSALGDARIAGRRGDDRALLATRPALTAAADALDRFIEAHG